ncbi:Actin-related protein 2/3 complex subunit 3 [Tetrabaena socialis]|uniref:Actin-related protein 2/3 complex subunit 3 n=1 Tax=Tetrabaena socialis TaxID=47790 RepID=A0A2J8AC48_9CHLO|nr:Actin-related protein 2/3 complex subunit 3 [Tetrabaena socialis]|eukprot:PNH10086.1 Actin-related protein 2/3 complex subunit 3 [Tetrabaena socialis]
MAYHSHFNSEAAGRFQLLCGCPIVPLNTPGGSGVSAAARAADGAVEAIDPVDEALELYRPLSLFKTFDVRGPGDKLLVYLILFINSCLKRLAERRPPPSREEARTLLFSVAHDRFPMPSQAGFPLGSLMAQPASKEEEDSLRIYLRQCREESGRRLVERMYGGGEGAAPNRHWLAFAHRRFMDRAV